jgi:peptidoglycan/xylan/chitin deacetylase (PgdA/CDA1 family)
VRRNKKSTSQEQLKLSQQLPFQCFLACLLTICLYGFFYGIHIVLAVSEVATPIIADSKSYPAALRQIITITPDYGENRVLPTHNTDTGIVSHGERVRKEVALTFDADMTPWMLENLKDGTTPSLYDKRITEFLEQTNTKATLFLTGMWIEAYRDDAAKLAANPIFELANHSYSHPSFDGFCYGLPQMEPGHESEEVMKTQEMLFALTHKQNTLFRFPGGCYSKENLSFMQSKGITAIQWDVAGEDGFATNTAAVENNVISNVHNGSIIVLHMNGAPNDPVTADALPAIVTRLKEEGYTFVTVSELITRPSKSIKLSLNQLISMQ